MNFTLLLLSSFCQDNVPFLGGSVDKIQIKSCDLHRRKATKSTVDYSPLSDLIAQIAELYEIDVIALQTQKGILWE